MTNGQSWINRNSPRIVLLLVIFIGIIILINWLNSTTIVLIIRHAERDNSTSCGPLVADSALSEDGLARAQILVHVAEEAGIEAIYASEYCRTKQTVQPLATMLSLPVIAIDQSAPDGTPDVDELIAHLWANNRGKVVLIAGHTSTIPVIIEKLGGGTISPINESEFDNLYVVTIPTWGKTKVVHLKYGAP